MQNLVKNTAFQFNDSRLDTKYSLPVELIHKGYPNRFRLPYRRSHTAGQIEGKLLEFPETVFPRTRFSQPNVGLEAVWIKSFDD